MNAHGQLVGAFTDAIGTHGYVREPDGTFHIIDVPDTSFTIPRDINDFGQLTGFYRDGEGKPHSFLATPIPVTTAKELWSDTAAAPLPALRELRLLFIMDTAVLFIEQGTEFYQAGQEQKAARHFGLARQRVKDYHHVLLQAVHLGRVPPDVANPLLAKAEQLDQQLGNAVAALP